ncbi:unnamed protein product [Clonostachys rosea]|uniref:Wax synthase domain-containing protein n=1 Tax=Bionectria ochroleuca TaxID=29856 RepID=A0ABY6UCE8_BIOOC|nr:unnamed protein product [Clonostachys rosea]
MSDSTSADEKYGWVPSPNGRGTLDIIWSCILVLVTCTWTVLHINVPEPDEAFGSKMLRKLRWAVWTIFAPEDVMLAAALHWTSARISKREMNSAGISDWTIAHGFLADSGGFMLRTPDFPPFPVNSRGVLYLVTKNYIEVPTVTKAQIEDSSKSDRLGKTVALTQSIYLVCQVIGRAVQGLEVTCLEILTLAYLNCALPTYYFWLNKPLDREVPIYIDMEVPISTVLREAGDIAAHQYRDTPLDFVEQPGWAAWRRRQRFSHFFGLTKRPLRRVPNDYVCLPSFWVAVSTWFFTTTHSAIHLAAWNSDLPSQAEAYLWKASAICLLAILFSSGIVGVISLTPGFDYTITTLGIWEKRTTKPSAWHDWAIDGPGTLASILYFMAKTVLLVLSFTTLRWMPASAFKTVEWADFLPHCWKQ